MKKIAYLCMAAGSLFAVAANAGWHYQSTGTMQIYETRDDGVSVNWRFRVKVLSESFHELKINDSGWGKSGAGVLDLTEFENDTGWKVVDFGGLPGIPEHTMTGRVVLPDVRKIGKGFFAKQDITELYAPKLTSTVAATKETDGSFYNCQSLTSVYIPKIVELADYSFSGCLNLSDVGSLNELVNLKQYAFKGCSSLTAFPMTLPSLRKVDNYGFNGLPLTGDLYLPAVTNIGGFCFSSAALTSVHAPQLEWAGANNTFKSATGITNIVVGHNLKVLGEGNFNPYLPTGLISFTPLMPHAMQSVYSSAFTSLSRLSSPLEWDCPGKTVIPSLFFSGCSQINNITIGASVTEIQANAFKDISKGASVQFKCAPAIADKAFYYKNGAAETSNNRPRFYITTRSALQTWQERVAENDDTFRTFKTTKADYPGKKAFGLYKISSSAGDLQYAWVIDATPPKGTVLGLW